MANKQALRDLQSRLAERLKTARTQQRGRSWLAVECSGRGFLFPLRDAGEIFAMTPLLPVPHTHAWFLGVANLRGHLHGVVDLAAFLGVKRTDETGREQAGRAQAGREQARLVGFNAVLDINCVLWVDGLSGLRNEEQLAVDAGDAPAGARPAFVGARYRDAAGRLWQELNLAELAGDESFLRIVD